MTQEEAFQQADAITFKGVPATLTKRDLATLQAMGLDLFKASAPDGLYKGAFRDAILAVWLATRKIPEKKAAFREPAVAIDSAYDWHETECGGSMDGLADCFGQLLAVISAATVDFKSSDETGGELPP